MERVKFDREANKGKLQRFAIHSKASQFAVQGNGLGVKGYFAVWDVLSGDRGGYLVSFAKGGMRLPSYDVLLYYNHNDDYPLAREENGSLVVGEDEHGGYMEAKLVDAQYERDLLQRINSKLVPYMSCGVFPLKTHMEERLVTPADAEANADIIPLIGLTVPVEVWDEYLLDEATICARPAFPQTNCEGFKHEKENGEDLDIYEMEALVMASSLD